MRESLSGREKLAADAAYHYFVTGDLEKERQAFELVARVYPRDPDPPFALGNLYVTLGQHEKALEGARDALRLEPSSPLNHAFLADTYLNLNRRGDARNTIKEGQRDGFAEAMHGESYVLAFLESDAADRSRHVAWAAGKPGVEDVYLGLEADTSAYYGMLADARAFSRRAVASAERAELKETKAGHEADIALIEALVGNKVKAREQANNPRWAIQKIEMCSMGLGCLWHSLGTTPELSRSQTTWRDVFLAIRWCNSPTCLYCVPSLPSTGRSRGTPSMRWRLPLPTTWHPPPWAPSC